MRAVSDGERPRDTPGNHVSKVPACFQLVTEAGAGWRKCGIAGSWRRIRQAKIRHSEGVGREDTWHEDIVQVDRVMGTAMAECSILRVS